MGFTVPGLELRATLEALEPAVTEMGARINYEEAGRFLRFYEDEFSMIAEVCSELICLSRCASPNPS